MKQNAKLAALTLDELNDKKKKLKGIVIGLGIVMIAAVSALLYIAFTSEKKIFLVVIAMSCVTSFLPIIISLSQLNKEIKSRNK